MHSQLQHHLDGPVPILVDHGHDIGELPWPRLVSSCRRDSHLEANASSSAGVAVRQGVGQYAHARLQAGHRQKLHTLQHVHEIASIDQDTMAPRLPIRKRAACCFGSSTSTPITILTLRKRHVPTQRPLLPRRRRCICRHLRTTEIQPLVRRRDDVQPA